MDRIAVMLVAAILAATISCKPRVKTDDSAVKDIGAVNTADARTLVLYEDQDKVYLKVCKPPLAPPLTRACPSDETPKFMELSVYLYKLPFDVGPYQRDQQGLNLVAKALQDARSAVDSGNQNAVPTVDRLEPIKLNLEKLLSISNDLKAQQQDLTYYEYQDEFSKLLVPFGDTGGSSGTGSEVPPSTLDEIQRLFDGANRLPSPASITGEWSLCREYKIAGGTIDLDDKIYRFIEDGVGVRETSRSSVALPPIYTPINGDLTFDMVVADRILRTTPAGSLLHAQKCKRRSFACPRDMVGKINFVSFCPRSGHRPLRGPPYAPLATWTDALTGKIFATSTVARLAETRLQANEICSGVAPVTPRGRWELPSVPDLEADAVVERLFDADLVVDFLFRFSSSFGSVDFFRLLTATGVHDGEPSAVTFEKWMTSTPTVKKGSYRPSGNNLVDGGAGVVCLWKP